MRRVNSFAANPIFPNLSLHGSYRGRSPITQFYDADKYVGLNASAGINQGLSEYTNANFFSNDTLFAAERYQPDHKHYFPYPKKTSTNVRDYISQIIPLLTISGEDGVEDKSTYIKKISDGETIEHFVRPSRWTPRIYSKYGESSRF